MALVVVLSHDKDSAAAVSRWPCLGIPLLPGTAWPHAGTPA